MEFLNKWYFIFIALIPLIIFLFVKSQKNKSIKFKFTNDIEKIFPFSKLLFVWKVILICSILLFFILILANPNKPNVKQDISKNWIDIVITLDISASMNAEDLKPSRIQAAKQIISKFLNKIKDDRVWLVVFAWKPFVSLPLTFDYNVVKQTLKNLSTNTINQNNPALNWTAIWDAILMATNLFKEDENKNRTKIIILLTDWDANKWVDPLLAAKYAKNKWIKIYTIWIGSPWWGYINYQVGPFIQKVRIPPLNSKYLQQIAQITNWKFYRATDNKTLEKIFEDIAKLTKTKIKVKKQITYQPIYLPFARILSLLLFLYLIVQTRKIV